LGRDDPKAPGVEKDPATDHMDMGCTPIDDKTFLVGDPSMARDAIATFTPKERAQLEEVLSKRAGHEVKLPDASASGPFQPRNRDDQSDFDAYAHILEAKGYKVLRVPHLEPPKDRDPYISYNNCLMERFEKDGKEVRRVFLPHYGIQKLDEAADKVWKSQGFEVHPIPLGALSAEWGALRCVSNWLDRSPRG
jgi:N-dimethylarginine dimethylaminohydrolase